MFREYQRMGSEGSDTRIRTISGVSQDSELHVSANGELHEEETAPSTVIELRVEEQVADRPTDSEERNNQVIVPVSNILAREEGERGADTPANPKETQEVEEQNAAKELEEDETRSKEDDLEPEANLDGKHVKTEQVENDLTKTDYGKDLHGVEEKDETDDADGKQTAMEKNENVEAVKMSDEDDGKINDVSAQAEDCSSETVKETEVVETTDASSEKNKDDAEQEEMETKQEEKSSEKDTIEETIPSKEDETKDAPAPMVEVDLNRSTSTDESKLHIETTEAKTTDASPAEASAMEVKPVASISQDAGSNQDQSKVAVTESSATKTKEIKIARLDVSSVASDTERLELKQTSTTVCCLVFYLELHTHAYFMFEY